MSAVLAPVLPAHMPISSAEAEFAVLGAIFINPDAIENVKLSPEDFFDLACRETFEVMLKFAEDGIPIDVVTVAEKALPNGMITKAGGLAWLGEVQANTPGAANVGYYADLVRDKSIERRLSIVGAQFDQVARAIGTSAEEKLLAADSMLTALTETRRVSNDPVVMRDALETYCETLADRENGIAQGYKTGLRDLDEITTGLHPGMVYVIGARPAMGKTGLVIGWAEKVAGHKIQNEDGSLAAEQPVQPVLVLSLEMPRDQIVDRTISNIASVNYTSLLSGKLQEDEWTRVTAGMGRIYNLPLYIDDQATVTLLDVRRKVRRVKKATGGKLAVVIIDYLQLMEGEGENNNVKYGNITKGLKRIAKEFGVAVVLLSQLSRELEKRPNKRPVMSDLRDSGAIEADADSIFFIYRDEVYNPDSPDVGTAEIIIGKNRHGPLKTVRSTFIGEYVRFENHEYN